MLLLASTSATVKAPIVAISMFKNGYAVVTRHIEVPGPGTYDLAEIPRASLGTLWFTATPGTEIESIKAATKTATIRSESTVDSLDRLLSANLGKEVRIGTESGDDVTGKSVQGKLISAGELIILQTAAGTLAFPKADVSSVSSVSGPLQYTVATTTEATSRSLEFSMSGKAGQITMISLEQGATWSPAYAVDITDKKKLTLVAKATVLDDLEAMDGVEARFVTGFPNIAFASAFDPLIGDEPVQTTRTNMGSAGGPGFGGQIGGRADTGGQGLVPEGIQFIGYNPTDNSTIVDQGMSTSRLPGEQLQDLFFYRQPSVSMKQGERAYFALFSAEAPYKELYTWDSEDRMQDNENYRQSTRAAPDDVWHTVQFKNTSGHPLTTAPATTFQNGQILGQDLMNYVSTGGDAELRITKALDIRAEDSEEETSRERGAIKTLNDVPQFDRVTLKGTLQAVNLKKEPVNLRMRHPFTGELVSADGDPEVKKTARGLRNTNPTGLLTWTKTIEPGQRLTLTYTYRVFVRSQ